MRAMIIGTVDAPERARRSPMSKSMSKMSRRKFVTTGLAAAAGVSGIAVAAKPSEALWTESRRIAAASTVRVKP